jgi:hypothetical protein
MKLETAQKLKDAGLPWEPQVYDYFKSNHGIENVDSLTLFNGEITYVNHWNWRGDKYRLHGLVWLPRLDQLLAEIEKRGYWWRLDKISAKDAYNFFLYVPGGSRYWESNFPEEAAAQALLWILEQERTRRDEPMG